MGSNWPLVKLGDFVQITTGHPFKSREYSEIAGRKLLRGDNIIQRALIWQNVKMLPKDKIGPKEQNYYLRTGDVILAMDRPWIEAGLKTAQINESDLPCLLVQRVACLRCENPTDQDFIRYIISSYDFVQYVKSIQTGTAIPHISGKQIKEFEFRLPPENIRKKIGEIIKQLDDKAHLNRQINQTLEQMAQALFKSWFVDFDPAVDNALDAGFFEQDLDLPDELLRRAEARQAARKQSDFKPLPDATRQLFPAAFEACAEPSLGLGGWVPKGWMEKKISELVDTISKTYPLKTVDEVIFLNTGDIENGHFLHANYSKVDGLPGQAKKTIQKDDILFSEIRPKNKRFAFVGFDAHNYVVSTKLMVLRAKECIHPLFAYFLLTLDETTNELQRIAELRSGTFPQITFSELSLIKFVLPSTKAVMEHFITLYLEPFFKKSLSNRYESESLIKLRDTLLPKLISGELLLDDIGAELATE